MRSAADYRRFARQSRRLAAALSKPADKRALELMAKGWERAAEKWEAMRLSEELEKRAMRLSEEQEKQAMELGEEQENQVMQLGEGQEKELAKADQD